MAIFVPGKPIDGPARMAELPEPMDENVLRIAGRPTIEESQALRTRVIEIALQTLRTGGSERMVMDRIAEKASVTKRTIYRQFGSKAGLIDEVVRYELERVIGAVSQCEAVGECPLEALRCRALRIFRFTGEDGTIRFTNFLSFESMLDPILKDRGAFWHIQVIETIMQLVAAAQRSGLLIDRPVKELSLLLLDLTVAANNRRRVGIETERAFAGLEPDEFFDRRWQDFMTLSSPR